MTMPAQRHGGLLIALPTFIAASLGAGCANLQSACPPGAGPRGLAVVSPRRATIVVEGPVMLHGIAAWPGALLYRVRARTGTDRDCALIAPRDAGARAIAPGEQVTMAVPEGHVACLATETDRAVELAWHLHPEVRLSILAEVAAGGVDKARGLTSR